MKPYYLKVVIDKMLFPPLKIWESNGQFLFRTTGGYEKLIYLTCDNLSYGFSVTDLVLNVNDTREDIQNKLIPVFKREINLFLCHILVGK